MERIGTAAAPQLERYRSFDPLASIDLLQFDLQTCGEINQATKQRILDEELTYIAEGINRPLRTPFVLQEVNGDIAIFDKGKWVPYMSTLTRGFVTAKREAAVDPRKNFLVERAVDDWNIGYKLTELQPGQNIVWHSSYPTEEEQLYGETFIGDLGFQVKRKMGFFYRAEKLSDGSLVLCSQSVDNSDDEAFTVALNTASNNPAIQLDDLVAVYDSVLGAKYEDKFFAGRRKAEHTSIENAWDFILKQRDIIEMYINDLEDLANQTDMPRAELERSKKRLTYGVWAYLKQRLDESVRPMAFNNMHQTSPMSVIYMRQEINMAYLQASAKGEVLFGCGGAIKGEESILSADSQDVFESIFGRGLGSIGEDKYGSLNFECPKGHKNTRPRNELIEKCKTCGTSVKC